MAGRSGRKFTRNFLNKTDRGIIREVSKRVESNRRDAAAGASVHSSVFSVSQPSLLRRESHRADPATHDNDYMDYENNISDGIGFGDDDVYGEPSQQPQEDNQQDADDTSSENQDSSESDFFDSDRENNTDLNDDGVQYLSRSGAMTNWNNVSNIYNHEYVNLGQRQNPPVCFECNAMPSRTSPTSK